MLLKTFSSGTQIRTFTKSNDFLQKNLLRCHSGPFRCHSGSFRFIPVHSGPFRFIPVSFRCHSGPFRSIPVHFVFIPVHSGAIPVNSGPFRCHSGSFRSIPPHSGSFRSISVFSNALAKALLAGWRIRYFYFLTVVLAKINVCYKNARYKKVSAWTISTLFRTQSQFPASCYLRSFIILRQMLLITAKT